MDADGGLDWAAVTALLEPQRQAARPQPHPDPGRDLSHLSRWVAAQGEGNRNAGLFWAANRALDADPAADLSPLAAAARQAGLGDGRSPGPWTPPAGPGSPARPHPTTRPRQATPRDRPHHPPGRAQPRQPRAAPSRPRPRDTAPAARLDLPSIAAATALSPGTVYALATGRRTAQPATATAVLKLTRRILSGSRLDAGGTRLRLRALHVMGHGSARIARAAGAHPQTIRQLVRGDARTVSPRLRTAIIVVYDTWWDKRAPARTRSERAAATIARKRAIAGNWCAAAALDDDLLDLPGYRPQPGWMPATGTGTAPDIHPPTDSTGRSAHAIDDRMNRDLIPRSWACWTGTGTTAATASTPARPSGPSATSPASTKAPRTLPAAATSLVPSPQPPGPSSPARTPSSSRPAGQNLARRAGRRRRIQARPGRDVR